MRIYRMLIVVAAILISAGTALARHRSAPQVPSMEVNGVIKSISSTQIVVTVGGNHDVTVAITADTIFRKGDVAAAPADFKIGDRVEVKAVMKDNVLTAALIKLENDQQQQPELLEIHGVIKSVSATQMVVTDAHNTDITVKITADTTIRKGDHAATVGDLAIGDRVEVKASVSAGVNTAVWIQAEGAEGEEENEDISGSVTAIGSDSITVSNKVVKVDAHTTIRRGDQRIALADIHLGDSVEVKATRLADQTLLATEIQVRTSGGHH